MLLFMHLFLYAISFAQEWKIESAKVNFEIENFGSTVTGSFSDVKVSVVFNPSNIAASSVNATIKVSSINTGNKTRDKHLKGEEYFNEASYEEIFFKSTEILPTSQKDKYIVNGDLTIKGVSKDVSIHFVFQEKEKAGMFSAILNLNRLDYKVGSSSWILGDEVKVTIELSTIKMTK